MQSPKGKNSHQSKQGFINQKVQSCFLSSLVIYKNSWLLDFFESQFLHVPDSSGSQRGSRWGEEREVLGCARSQDVALACGNRGLAAFTADEGRMKGQGPTEDRVGLVKVRPGQGQSAVLGRRACSPGHENPRWHTGRHLNSGPCGVTKLVSDDTSERLLHIHLKDATQHTKDANQDAAWTAWPSLKRVVSIVLKPWTVL